MYMNETALVLIDLQKESSFGLLLLDDVLLKTKDVIRSCRNADIQIIYTRQINRTDNLDLFNEEPMTEDVWSSYYNFEKGNYNIMYEIAPEADDIVIDKYRWSAFHETSLYLILRSLGIKHLIIGGVVTDGCVMTTVYDAYFRDYNVHLIKDMCATSNEGAHMASLMIMANWVYNLEIYNANHIIKRLNGQKYSNCTLEKTNDLQ